MVDTSGLICYVTLKDKKEGWSDHMVGIVVEGEAAAIERRRLLEDGREVPVALRERDANGNMMATWFQFGMGSDVAWVFSKDETEGSDSKTVLEEVLAHEAAELFGCYLDRMMIRQGLVDSSPLSPELVEISPCIRNVVQDLEAEFGVKIAIS